MEYIIEDNRLINCTGDETEITIPDGVTEIELGAFNQVKDVEVINAPDSLKKLNLHSLNQLHKLRKINAPVDCEISGYLTYNHLEPEEKYGPVIVGSTFFGYSPYNSSFSGPIPEYVKTAYFLCGYDEDYVHFPAHIEKIVGCYCDCDYLKEVVIDNPTAEIISSFNGCKKLANKDGFVIYNGYLLDYFGKKKDLIIPEEVHTIDDSCFSGNGCIESVVFPHDLKKIGHSVFSSCSNLKTVTLPKHVEEIGSAAFGDCPKLDKITFPEKVNELGEDVFRNCAIKNLIYDGYLLTFSYSGGNVVIPANVKTISCWVGLFDETIETVTIPEGVEYMKGRSFYKCPNLKDVYLPKSLKSIDESFGKKSVFHVWKDTYGEEFAKTIKAKIIYR